MATTKTNSGLAIAKAEIDRLAALIDAPEQLLPTYGSTEDFARPHIEYSGSLYDYVVVERGEELSRLTGNLAATLERTFDHVTSSMASKFAIGHDRYRDVMFEHQLELLGKLDQRWRDRRAERIKEILRKYP
jgi:hypothetical protein